MKSSESQLKSRGKITIQDLQHYNCLTKNELDDDLINVFLHTLSQEKKLYTKIELCEALSKGNVKSAKIMIKYLGQIGSNQHKVLPSNDFKKQSYPLPRDIIARTLSHMNKEILPVLLDALKTDNILTIREVIDAIGFMCFYQKLHSNHQIIDALLLCLKTNFKDDITRWKLVRAFESFNDINVIHTLLDIEKNDGQPIIRNEAKRSLKIINSRTGN